MNDQPKDGGPAFPGLTYVSWNGQKNPEGISMRDYFAAAALQGLLADGHGNAWCNETCSAKAFKIADAMIKAKEAKP